MAPLRVVGIDFDHMHMGDLLREVHEHPDAEIAGVCDADPKRMQLGDRDLRHPAGTGLHRSSRAVSRDARPDLIVLCAAPASHAAAMWNSSRPPAPTSWSKSRSRPRPPTPGG